MIKSKYPLLFIIPLLLVGACTLNAHQEETLSHSVTRYLAAKRKGVTLAYVSLIHPDFVRYYQAKGDSVFRSKFHLEEGDEYLIDDPSIQTTKKEGDLIHVSYKAKEVNYYSYGEKTSEQIFVAVSNDNGETWLFVPGPEYFDKTIVPKFERLIKKN